jgi:hypothetical protein
MPISTPPEHVTAYGKDSDHFTHVFGHLFKPEATGCEPLPGKVFLRRVSKKLAVSNRG